MRFHLLALAAGLALAACDAPAPAPASDANLAARTQTPVVTVPDATSGPAISPPVEPSGQRVSSTAPPPAQDLKFVQFAVGSDAVPDDALQDLSRFARYLTKFRKSVVITGFTRRMPDLAAAQDLSARRAQAVRRFLILHDVSAAQITASGRGDAQPLDPGETEEAMARNDRVELTLVQTP